MNIVTIDVNIQKLNSLVQQIEQVANEQTLAARPAKRKVKTDLSSTFASKREVTLNYVRKKRDISQTKKLY